MGYGVGCTELLEWNAIYGGLRILVCSKNILKIIVVPSLVQSEVF